MLGAMLGTRSVPDRGSGMKDAAGDDKHIGVVKPAVDQQAQWLIPASRGSAIGDGRTEILLIGWLRGVELIFLQFTRDEGHLDEIR
ncbi:MAG: hypothetical protein RLZZ165_1544 [Bacteroidota bacterium]